MSPLPAGDVHRPVMVANPLFHRGGAGVFSYYVCSCGLGPAQVPLRIAYRDLWYRAHRDSLGLTHVHGLSEAVYGPGYPGAGMTWQQWRKLAPGVNPFTGETHQPLAPRADRTV